MECAKVRAVKARMAPSIVGHEVHDQTNWGETNRTTNVDWKQDFNRIRIANINLQLAKIKECWQRGSPSRPVWGLITVETGYKDVKKIGLVLRPTTVESPYTTGFHALQEQIKSMMKGEGEEIGKALKQRGGGDMDEFLEFNDPDDLNAEELFRKSKICKADLEPVSARLDVYDAPRAPSTYGHKSKRDDALCIKHLVEEPVRKAKNLGVSDNDILSMCQEILKQIAVEKPVQDMAAVRNACSVAWICIEMVPESSL